MNDILRILINHLERHEHLVQASILTHEGSTPRSAGSRMLLGADEGGECLRAKTRIVAGTVGGGLVEARVMEAGAQVLADGLRRVESFDLTGELAAGADMICGGRLRVLLERLGPADLGLLRGLAHALDAGKRGLRLIPLGQHGLSTEAGQPGLPDQSDQSTEAGQPGLPDQSGLSTEAGLPDQSDQSTKAGQPDQSDQSGLPTEAGQGRPTLLLPEGRSLGAPLPPELEQAARRAGEGISAPVALEHAGAFYALEPWAAASPLFIFGAGHVSRPTAQIAALAGFRVTVLDDRAEFANAGRFPQAALSVLGGYADCFAGHHAGPEASVVIVTRGHLHDAEVLAQALATRAGYIGMIGSRRKRDAVYERLRGQGFADADLARVRCPIGLAIGAETPEEIAVSIVAELVQVRAGHAPAGERYSERNSTQRMKGEPSAL